MSLSKTSLGHERKRHGHSTATIFKAWMPWLVLSVVVFVWGFPPISNWLDAHTTIKFSRCGSAQL